MSHLTTIPVASFVEIVDGKPVTNTRVIASYFEREHRHVRMAVERLDCSPSFNTSNFLRITYIDQRNRKQEMFNVTRDGFMFLAMGFTGPKAAQVKEAFISAFNDMERRLQAQQAVKLEHAGLCPSGRAGRAQAAHSARAAAARAEALFAQDASP